MAVNLEKDNFLCVELRRLRRGVFHMDQQLFALEMGFNLGTLRNWEQGISKPPEYVLRYVKLEAKDRGLADPQEFRKGGKHIAKDSDDEGLCLLRSIESKLNTIINKM